MLYDELGLLVLRWLLSSNPDNDFSGDRYCSCSLICSYLICEPKFCHFLITGSICIPVRWLWCYCSKSEWSHCLLCTNITRSSEISCVCQQCGQTKLAQLLSNRYWNFFRRGDAVSCELPMNGGALNINLLQDAFRFRFFWDNNAHYYELDSL